MARARTASQSSDANQTSENEATETDTSSSCTSPSQEQGPLRAAGPSVGLKGPQRKPVLSRPGDRYEQEANAFAAGVETGTAPPALSRVDSSDLGGAQRQREEDEEAVQPQVGSTEEEEEPVQKQVGSTEEEEEAPVQTQPEEDEEAPVQSDDVGGGGTDGGRGRGGGRASKRDVAARALRTTGPGRSMDRSTRHTIEQRGGVDLSGVRIHDGPGARSSAEALGARAFTHGRDIWLGPGASDRDLSLMAHEAAHVVQQGAAAQVQRQPEEDEPVQPQSEDEEEPVQAQGRASERDAPIQPQVGSPEEDEEAIQNQTDDEEETGVVQGGFWEASWEGVTSAADVVAETAGEVTLKMVKEVLPAPAVEFIQTVANHPDGVLGVIYEKLKTILAGVFDVLGDQSSVLEGSIDTFKGFLARARQIVQALIAGDCDPLFQAISDLKAIVGELAGDAWAALTDFLEPVKTFLVDVKEKVAEPIGGWIKTAGGAVWGKVRSVWEKITGIGSKLGSALKSVAGPVRNWITDKLGFEGGGADEGESGNSIKTWIKDKASAAWSKVTEPFAPVIGPMQSVVDKAKELVPLDAIKTMQEKLQSFQQNMGQMDSAAGSPDDVVQNQGRLREAILPGLLGVVDSVIAVVGSAKSWLVSTVQGLTGPVNSFFSALEGVDFLSGAVASLQWLRDGVSKIQRWAATVVGTLFDVLMDALRHFKGVIRPVYRTLMKVVGVLGDFVGGIKELLQSVWTQIPGCIRDKLKDFLIDKILANVPFFDTLRAVKGVWDTIVSTVYRALFQVFVNGDLIGAAWTIFQALLRAIGLPPELVTTLLNNVLSAFRSVFQDPIGFLVNLVKALQKGFMQFIDHFPTHLLDGLTDWLFGALRQADVEPPESLQLSEIFRFVLDVLGITVDKVVRMLAETVGVSKEKMDGMIEKLQAGMEIAKEGLGWIQKLATEGPSAIWEWIEGQLSGLWNSVIEAITSWMQTKIMKQVAKRLALFLDPSGIGTVVNIVLTIWRALQSVGEYAKELVQIVNSVFEGVNSIAKGVINTSAGILETALADALPVAIGFLARQVNLSDLPQRIGEMLKAIRGKVDEALNWLIGKTVGVAKKAFYSVRKATGSLTGEEKQNENSKQKAKEEIRAAMMQGILRDQLAELVSRMKRKYNLKRAELDSNEDVVLANSDEDVIRGEMWSKGDRKEFVGEGEEVKNKEEKTKLGTFDANAPSVPTAKGVLSGTLPQVLGIGIRDVPFLNKMSESSRRPDVVEAEFENWWSVDGEKPRVKSTTTEVGDYGQFESLLEGGSKYEYVGGHLIAASFGAPDDYKNLVPMLSKSVNAWGSGVWGQLEKDVFQENIQNVSAIEGATFTIRTVPRYGVGDVGVTARDLKQAIYKIEGEMSGRRRGEYDPDPSKEEERVGSFLVSKKEEESDQGGSSDKSPKDRFEEEIGKGVREVSPQSWFKGGEIYDRWQVTTKNDEIYIAKSSEGDKGIRIEYGLSGASEARKAAASSESNTEEGTIGAVPQRVPSEVDVYVKGEIVTSNIGGEKEVEKETSKDVSGSGSSEKAIVKIEGEAGPESPTPIEKAKDDSGEEIESETFDLKYSLSGNRPF